MNVGHIISDFKNIPQLRTDYLYYFNDKAAALKTGKIK